jgi:hypothetical protein
MRTLEVEKKARRSRNQEVKQPVAGHHVGNARDETIEPLPTQNDPYRDKKGDAKISLE